MAPKWGSVGGPSDVNDHPAAGSAAPGSAIVDFAIIGDLLHVDLIEVTDDLRAVDEGGPWVVVLPYDGPPICALFGETHPASRADELLGGNRPGWIPPPMADWSSSLDRSAFMDGVGRIRSEIADGNVYQANLTRVMSAPARMDDPWSLAKILMRANPAPYFSVVSLDRPRVRIISASPELFLHRRDRTIRTSPIKGTAATPQGFLPKDEAENIMIVDLARNDLGRICDWGSIEVTDLLATEAHPGLFHLVSTVRGTLREGCTWSEIIEAMFPPASVTGAPKIAAVDLISRLEPVDRRFYCGAIGRIDDDGATGELNVAIRTFWLEDSRIHFGTGGGITYGSDPEGEWEETELKARNLIGAVSGSGPAGNGTVNAADQS